MEFELNHTIILSIYKRFSKIQDYSILFEDRSIQQAANYMSLNSHKISLNHELINLACDFNISNIIKNFLAYLRSQISTEEEIIFDLILVFIRILKHFCKNKRFSDDFHRHNGLKFFFIYIIDIKLIIKHSDSDRIQRDKYEKILVHEVLSCCFSLTKSFDNYKHKWKEINALENIVELADNFDYIPKQSNVFQMILLNIFDNDEVRKFPNAINNAIEKLSEMLNKNTSRLESGEFIERCLVNLNDTAYHVLFMEKCNIIDILDIFCRITLYCNGTEIYFEIKNAIKSIVLNGNQIEKSHAIKLLWQLCFEEKVAKDVKKDDFLIENIQNNVYIPDVYKELKENSKGLIWLLNRLLCDNSESKTDIFDILISYTNDSRDYCSKIKQDLQNDGLKVWIDYEQSNGSSLDVMNKAVENSKCVLIFVSEMYNMSPKSRCVIEYTFILNKPIISLIMQENCTINGWLNFILQTKYFLEFTKHEYGECLKILKHQIKRVLDNSIIDKGNEKFHSNEFIVKDIYNDKIEQQVVKMPLIAITKEKFDTSLELNEDSKPDDSFDFSTSEEPMAWTRVKIANWFVEKKFNTGLFGGEIPSNGKMLKELFETSINSNEKFYSKLSPNRNLPIKDVAYFSLELKNIFRPKRFIRRSQKIRNINRLS